MWLGFGRSKEGVVMNLKISLHRTHNKFPNILWKYIWPKWLNCITWKKGDPKVYKWLWFAIWIPSKGEINGGITKKIRHGFAKNAK